MSTTITFYDIKSNRGAWSPNAWKIRLALNLKGIPYKTHWLSFTEIEPFMKKLGANPTGKKPAPDDAEDLYTCPVIAISSPDGSSPSKLIEESDAIAEYLDAAYPDTPKLFPTGTRALQAAFGQFFLSEVMMPTSAVLVPGLVAILDEVNAKYVEDTRMRWYGAPVSTWAPLGSEKRAGVWKAAEEAWGKLAAVYAKSDGVWISGAQPVYADFIVVALLACAREVVQDSEFAAILKWHGGVWGKLWEASSPYLAERQ
ncbi:hypothetical protein EXIGLDRAFT_769692 [Exidia glandulosa HHB12029]|uniref:GST N-terminal domain-containing protein n=1 Tax=Exidia glandulosa HHB12029 TaxID=1314781 RepID=A0A165H9M1_EXIGL|nr:hypothetical protein EXIGLDRAFT_769692 [Exidia glandulosa HHB12029]